MPAYIVERTQDILNERKIALNGARILLLGVTYKANIADQRESPAADIARKFQRKGAEVSFHDPYVQNWRAVPGVDRVESPVDSASHVDIVVLLQHHSEYDIDQIVDSSTSFFDTRGASPLGAANVHRL